jgi:hypothetical protein
MNIQDANSEVLLYFLGAKDMAKPRATSLPQPNFSRFDCCTKTTPTMSEEQYKEAIIELAKKDVASGKCSTSGNNNFEFMSLKKSFVSVVSPDRRSIIAAASRKLVEKGEVTFAEFRDNTGNIIASYCPTNGWTMSGTSAENARDVKFDAIYTAAWRAAHNDLGNKVRASNAEKPEATGNSIDTSA